MYLRKKKSFNRKRNSHLFRLVLINIFILFFFKSRQVWTWRWLRISHHPISSRVYFHFWIGEQICALIIQIFCSALEIPVHRKKKKKKPIHSTGWTFFLSLTKNTPFSWRQFFLSRNQIKILLGR